jgi:nucleotide-binding universal stress UspA family protein
MEPRVVSAHDPDSGDTSPLGLGRILARLLDARLVAVVVRPGGSASERLARSEGGRDPAGAVAALRASLRGEREEVLGVAAPSAAAGLHAALAAEETVLAVVGSAHDGTHGRVALGGTTERLLTAARCPVVVVPRAYAARRLQRIAVALVPSPEGRAALRAGARLAALVGAPLRVLTVLRDTPDADEALAVARELAPGLVPAPEAEGPCAVLAAGIAAAAAAGPLQIETRVLVGDPADALVRASASADLLLLGARAYGPADAVLAGGVARGVLGAARCPVVVLARAEPADAPPAFATLEPAGA